MYLYTDTCLLNQHKPSPNPCSITKNDSAKRILTTKIYIMVNSYSPGDSPTARTNIWKATNTVCCSIKHFSCYVKYLNVLKAKAINLMLF